MYKHREPFIYRTLILILILFLFLFTSLITAKSQLSYIGKGWAQNSVNAVSFRKNSVVYHKGDQYAAYYDSTGIVVLAKRKYGENNWFLQRTQYSGNINDAHCSISIIIDGNGYLHMAWGQHDNQLNYCKATSPGSLALGKKTGMTGNLEDTVSYPEFYNLPDGNILFMYRYGESGGGNLVINKYLAAQQSWKRLQTNLIDGEQQRNAYWQTFVDNNGVIHISWVWRETWDVVTNHDLCYAKSMDSGLTWQKSTGEKYLLPITISNAEVACTIPIRSDLINQTSMYADNKSRPYIASYWRPDTGSVPQYQLVYKIEGNWKREQISNRTTDFSLSGGGTKSIPISRPQLVVDDRNDSIKVYMIYRDSERGSTISMYYCNDIYESTWFITDISDLKVNSWEPTYDPELWKEQNTISLFVQKVGQGDSETLEDIEPQPVYILDINTIPEPGSIIKSNNSD